MADLQSQRVAVYIDFDNIVMSWYDRVHDVELYPSAWRSLGWEPWAYATVDA